jgi:sulfate adenylyltransferase subunit 2
MDYSLSDLDVLEAEAIDILRETAAAFERPVMLYSIGKDSGVLLHLAKKAFAPAAIPFPLMHIDTTWKFREMIEHRDWVAEHYGAELLVYSNPQGAEENITPFTTDAQEYTRVMKTVALRAALDGEPFGGIPFDAAIGGSRRDEERSRAKERVFSLRQPGHRWEPRSQRPEMWRTYNTRLTPGQSMRVFPLSNWTELDVWRYTKQENIPVVPLYYAAERPVVERNGSLIMIDDERFVFNDGETPVTKLVRFRSLGCYPLSAAVESTVTNIDDLIHELVTTRLSERAGRLIDGEKSASMEAKKVEGYF